jgi:hypothetical protein
MGYWPLGPGELTVTYVCASRHWQIAQSESLFLHLATSISLGIMASAPFSGVDDENLAIAYLSTLMLLFYVRSFPPSYPGYVGVKLTNRS